MRGRRAHLVGDGLQGEAASQVLLHGPLAQGVVGDNAVVAASMAGSTIACCGKHTGRRGRDRGEEEGGHDQCRL